MKKPILIVLALGTVWAASTRAQDAKTVLDSAAQASAPQR